MQLHEIQVPRRRGRPVCGRQVWLSGKHGQGAVGIDEEPWSTQSSNVDLEETTVTVAELLDTFSGASRHSTVKA
jgi:hypothetical protein